MGYSSYAFPCPRGFSWTYSTREREQPHEAAAPKTMRWGREIPQFILDLKSHSHASIRVRIWPSVADWLKFLQLPKIIWLFRIIWTTEGKGERQDSWRWGRKPFWRAVFVTMRFTGFVCTNGCFVKKVCGFKNTRFRVYVALEENLNLVLQKTLLAVLNRKVLLYCPDISSQ